jgi:hypothetical protein
MGKHHKTIQEDTDLTNQLVGTPAAGGKPAVKGLRQRHVEERDKRDGIVAEQRLVRPLFVNTAVESELTLQRLRTLQEREKELIEYLRKKHKIEVASGR